MSTNKSISQILCNKGIIVNLYKLHFLSSHFSFQPNKRVFHPPTFSPLQPNTHEGKLNIFYPPTNFLSFHFSTPPTKRTLRVCLFKGEIRWMENFEEKMGRKIFLSVFGWMGRKENKWWDSSVFSPSLPKIFLSKIERKLKREIKHHF